MSPDWTNAHLKFTMPTQCASLSSQKSIEEAVTESEGVSQQPCVKTGYCTSSVSVSKMLTFCVQIDKKALENCEFSIQNAHSANTNAS